jgi:adenylate cyclase
MAIDTKKILHGLLIGVAAALLAVLLDSAGILERLEARTWDWRVQLLASAGPATDQVVLIGLDQSSLDWGRTENSLSWPWPRATYAAVANFCRRGGARSVMFDMVYTEPSGWGVADDEEFGKAIHGNGKAGVALFLGREQGADTNWPVGVRSPALDIRGGDGLLAAHRDSMVLPRGAFPVPALATNTPWLASVHGEPDGDAIFRRSAPVHRFDGRWVPSLGLASYLASEGGCEVVYRDGVLRVGSHEVPLDAAGRAVLRFRGGVDAFRAFNAAQVIQSEIRLQEGAKPPIEPSVFSNRYVIFGPTAPGLMDLKPIPTSKASPGMIAHATFLDNLLSDSFVRPFPRVSAAFVAAAFCLVCGLVGRLAAKGWHSGAAFALLVVPFALGVAGYQGGYWLPVMPSVVGGAGALVGALVLNYALEGRQKRFIRGAFQQYLHPAVIDRLVLHPESLKLGGETRELSIYFSDIQGFTSISEVLTPEQLTALLNDYLTAMTDIVMEEGGTVDKYEGDAVIAFWNAPLDLPEHPICAVRSALRCKRKLGEMRPAFRARVGRDLFMRAGINTGPVVVGNMGSHQRFNYTFLGDAGNLASRLEGINKQFGTYVMMSEATAARVGSAFPSREISRVRVVGKATPVRVFEPMFADDYEAGAAVFGVFGKGLQAWYAGAFQDALAILEPIADRDAPARAYIQDCRKRLANPPENWEGVWQMTEK